MPEQPQAEPSRPEPTKPRAPLLTFPPHRARALVALLESKIRETLAENEKEAA